MSRILSISYVLIILLSGSAAGDVVELPSTNDAGVWEQYPDENYNNLDYAWVGYWYGDPCDSLIDFDLTPYLGATVNDASLELYVYRDWGAIPDDNWLYLVDGAWDETTLTWNTNPGYNTDISLNFGAPSVNDWLELDVTAFVQAWLDETYDNYGFYIMETDTSDIGVEFYCKEHVGTTYDPVLVLDYDFVSVKSASLGEIKAVFK